jgi:alkylation response protein AidB-like acyl-CoA dehydrogenase
VTVQFGLPVPLTLTTPATQHEAVLRLAAQVPSGGATWPDFLEGLLRLGATDVVLGRLTEGHLDALRILCEAGCAPVPGKAYAVWASRSQGTGIHAERVADGWVLDGTLRFASGTGVVGRALVPVWTTDGRHHLLDLDVSGWPVDDSAWATPAMALSRSHTVHLDRFFAPDRDTVAVGPPDFYLTRHSFHLGGIGVAAVWAGCATRVLRLAEHAAPVERRSPARQRRLGLARAEALAAVAVVRQAGREAEHTDDPRLLATWVRSSVVASAHRLIDHTRHLVGAAALAFDADLAAALQDLPLYLAQQDADGDATWLGQA